GLGAGSLRSAGCSRFAGTQDGLGLLSRLYALVIAVFCSIVPGTHPEYSSIAATVVSWARIAATGAGVRSEVRRLHGTLCRRKSGRWADHFAGGRAGTRSRYGGGTFWTDSGRGAQDL